jgi:hypothetical protein
MVGQNHPKMTSTQIKFRGQNIHKKWVYGYYLCRDGKHYIFDGEREHAVKGETVGHDTGLNSSDPIYPGDVVNLRNWGSTDEILGTAIIEWDADEKAYRPNRDHGIDSWYDMNRAICEVIGNIFDNPELKSR